MRAKRTGPTSPQPARKLLIFLGRPLFHAFLIAIYTAFILVAILARAIIRLIELVEAAISIVSKARLKNLLQILKTPIKFKLQLPALRRPTITPKFYLIAALLLITTATLAAAFALVVKTLPSPDKLKTREQIVSTKIYDRNGNLLFKIFKNENRTLVELEDIPPYLIEATIAIEDSDFYKHAGYSYRGILRAIRHTIVEGKVQGGSTITQQLVKNALLTPEKTITRKVKEIILAILAEIRFSKDELLTMYFNEVGYGGSAYGAEEAAQMYFNKSVQDLSLAESALLAGLPAAPTSYSPFGTNPELAKLRQHEVLRRMAEDGYITIEQAEQAKEEKLTFALPKTDIRAPHFVMFVKNILVEKFGDQVVEQGGLEVVTSLDLNIQNLAQKVVKDEVDRLRNLNISNGAALVTKPATGEILAMVGSRDFFDFASDGQVNVTIRPRQPGSAIKPINYAVALENGFTAATIIDDTPITYHIPGQPPYSPKNYDSTFHGKLTLRQALANSYNVPAVKTLSSFGVERMIDKGEKMGITTWNNPNRYGLSLTLGGGEVKMVDLATAYGSLANSGFRVDLAPILKVTDYRGRLLYEYTCSQTPLPKRDELAHAANEVPCEKEEVVSPEVAFILTDILSDRNARARAFGIHSMLNIPGHQVAVKTGTTQNLRDNWTIGYTTELLVAAWVGNNDNTPMSYVASGITGASPIWNNIMNSLLANQPAHSFSRPETLITKNICPITGTLPCGDICPGQPEYFIPGTEPTKACIPQQINLQENSQEIH